MRALYADPNQELKEEGDAEGVVDDPDHRQGGLGFAKSENRVQRSPKNTGNSRARTKSAPDVPSKGAMTHPGFFPGGCLRIRNHLCFKLGSSEERVWEWACGRFQRVPLHFSKKHMQIGAQLGMYLMRVKFSTTRLITTEGQMPNQGSHLFEEL